MSRSHAFLLCASLLCALPACAQFKTEIINAQGAEAPCIGIGPIGAPAAKKCVDAFLAAGFLKTDDLGISGLTIGTSGKDDGVVTKVDPNSPAALAGIAPGDAVSSIDDRPAAWTPGEVAAQLIFGPRGDTIHLTVRHAGAENKVDIVRAPQSVPNAPKITGFMTTTKPLINWQGQFVPCLGIGPAGMAAVEFCYKRFMPFGYVKVADLGSAGLQFDLKRTDKAILSAVDPGSPAAQASLAPGDEVVSVNGKVLSASTGEALKEHLFGKTGDQKKLVLHNASGEKAVTLTLAAPSKK